MLALVDASVEEEQDELVEKALLLAKEAQKSAAKATEASSTAQGVVMNVRMVSGMMGELSRGMGDVVVNTSESRKQANRVSEITVKTNDYLDTLMSRLDDISSLSELIQGVTRQTNMLALNAMIEAARAGDHGRGFAVVAGEVKSLAKQTAETTDGINGQLESIRSAADQLRASLWEVNESVTAIRMIMDDVAGAVNQQNESFSVMNTFANEAATSVEDIATTLDHSARLEQSMVDEITGLCGLLEDKKLNEN